MAAKKRKKAKTAAKAKRRTAKRRTATRRKRKPTAKQLRAWRKNIKKAQAALGRKTKRKTKRKTSKRRKRLTPAQKAARTRAKYKRQRAAYAPLLSPGIAAQQLQHRAQAKREDKALRRMYSDLKKGARTTKPLTLAQKADLALALLEAKSATKLKGLHKAIPSPTKRYKPLLKGIVKTKGGAVRRYRGFGPAQQTLKFGNPKRRRKARRNSAYPYTNPRRGKRRNPGAQWWIADLYAGGRKQTFIDMATRVEAEYSARQLASRHPGAKVELSGPYVTQPTASTQRR